MSKRGGRPLRDDWRGARIAVASAAMRTFLEFFAGGGMARAGLGPGWRCMLANDIDPAKAAAYRTNWGGGDMRLCDVATLATRDVPGAAADLAWASFPCQDLSLAGARGGLEAARSGAFWPFWRLIEALIEEGRGPKTVVLENVAGLLTSNGGQDFAALGGALAGAGFQFGAAVIDAAHFTPQSRPRLFVVAFRPEAAARLGTGTEPHAAWTTPALARAVEALPPAVRRAWRPLPLPPPPRRNIDLADVVEAEPTGVSWQSAEDTARLLALMTPLNRAKIEAAQAAGGRAVGAVFRRTRPEPGGGVRQRAEVRFDGVAGCLRTPAGGSSRQTLVVVEAGRVRSRLLSPREAARLMGLRDDYVLPERLNAALHLLGDGVAVRAVRFLAAHVLEPLTAELTPA